MPAEVFLIDSPEGINLPKLLAALAPPEVANDPVVRDILNVSLTNFNLYRANGGISIAGQSYSEGMSIRGRLNLWGLKASLEGKVANACSTGHSTRSGARWRAGTSSPSPPRRAAAAPPSSSTPRWTSAAPPSPGGWPCSAGPA